MDTWQVRALSAEKKVIQLCEQIEFHNRRSEHLMSHTQVLLDECDKLQGGIDAQGEIIKDLETQLILSKSETGLAASMAKRLTFRLAEITGQLKMERNKNDG